MNILFVADVSINKIIGGAERVLYEQTTRLSSRGHNVFLLTRSLPGQKQNLKKIGGVSENRYECNKGNAVWFLVDTLKNSKPIFEQLQREIKFDCINFHQPFTAFGVMSSNICHQIPKVYTCHSLAFEEFISRNGNKNQFIIRAKNLVQSKGYKIIEKNVLKKAEKIVALSEYTKNKVIKNYNIPKYKIQVIPGGVDLNRFMPNEKKNCTRKLLNIPTNKIVLFTVRNLVKRMGLENLVKALHELKNIKKEIYLIVGGEGRLKEDLKNLTKHLDLEHCIQFAGFIPEKQLPDYYRAADIFILPTKELEGFGLVTLEALASGLPVLGTPVGGTKEIVGKFDSSFLFKGTDPKSIAKKIFEKYQLIKHNPGRWQDISNRSRRFVERSFSWEKNIEALEDLFEKIRSN